MSFPFPHSADSSARARPSTSPASGGFPAATEASRPAPRGRTRPCPPRGGRVPRHGLPAARPAGRVPRGTRPPKYRNSASAAPAFRTAQTTAREAAEALPSSSASRRWPGGSDRPGGCGCGPATSSAPPAGRSRKARPKAPQWPDGSPASRVACGRVPRGIAPARRGPRRPARCASGPRRVSVRSRRQDGLPRRPALALDARLLVQQLPLGDQLFVELLQGFALGGQLGVQPGELTLPFRQTLGLAADRLLLENDRLGRRSVLFQGGLALFEP